MARPHPLTDRTARTRPGRSLLHAPRDGAVTRAPSSSSGVPRFDAMIPSARPARERLVELPPTSLYEWLRPLGAERRLQAGETLFKAGEPFRAIFLLRAGTVKRTLLHPDGREQVLGFALSGDLLGLASLGASHYQVTATALEMCLVLEIAPERLDAAVAADPRLGELLLSRLGHALRERHGWMVTLGALSADERVAAFLLDLSARFQARGYSGERFLLKMTRAEIGGLLGLTLETVSRVLSRFQQRGLIRLERREVAIVDRDGLRLTARGAVGGTGRPTVERAH